ncbi:MAG: triose-phosphate isomerase [Pseudanabaenaceae cyanobacterium SKYGB_i_bin29]|nr:triose-phosphate isomerase [Pseudanabaenaceae cyanobacterium SKYG29]MDW8420677.1 triose-phosphate isomerase [Pseudanabaenaceae cyanobacterium SKYGB_i_bin29]
MNYGRKQIIAGNWKMYKTQPEARDFLIKFLPQLHSDRVWWLDEQKSNHVPDIVICAPFTKLQFLSEILVLAPRNLMIGAQNIHWADEGPFTGEISGQMLNEYNVRYVIVGHSERRHYFCDTDETVRKRVMAAQAHNITPILCIGETKLQRESGVAEDVLTSQLTNALEGIDITNLVIAYEPVWAIGTGDTCHPQEANRMLKHIRSVLNSDRITLLYGGSVKPDNIDELMAQPEIDGVLVGGASLDPNSFARIVNFHLPTPRP